MQTIVKPEVDFQRELLQQAKVDLAAALRITAHLGLNEGVCNHFSMALPSECGIEGFLINPQGKYWPDLVPSDMVVVGTDSHTLDGHHSVEPTALYIHSCVHRAKESARCVMHAHMPYATALALLEGEGLEWVSQNSVRYYGRVAYDTEYDGLALDEREGERIASKLADADILFMANHGVMVCGETIANVFDDLYYLERACMVQVLAQSTGRKLRSIPEQVARKTAQQFEQERQQSLLHFEAMKLNLERRAPGWSRQ